MEIREAELRGRTLEKVRELKAAANLPRKLPWGPDVTVVSQEDASEPEQGRFGKEVIIEIDGQQWSYLGARDVDRDGFGVAWELHVVAETGEVRVKATPLVTPMAYP